MPTTNSKPAPSGCECWILPDLSKHVEIDNEEAVANRLLEACEKAGIYRLQNGALEVEKGSKLRAFMGDFELKQDKLSLEIYLPGRAVTFSGTHAASICTQRFAEYLAFDLRNKLVSSKSEPTRVALKASYVTRRILQEDPDRLVLKILNMRHEFQISPLAVIHGGEGAAGEWEVPETTRTILCPGDRLIFIEPHRLEEEKFQECVDRLNDATVLSKLPETKRFLSDGSPTSPPTTKAKKRKTRRGGGGKKNEKRKEKDAEEERGKKKTKP